MIIKRSGSSIIFRALFLKNECNSVNIVMTAIVSDVSPVCYGCMYIHADSNNCIDLMESNNS